ncbi:hypothetical protein [Bacillus cereus]|uniref:hypothetical protein n=1 Tax=Bacillus cereus TaxID=1396 RepID=UPI000BF560DF|nr:hypothetical protein [Bacillus cereus]PFC99689.1 hypothetical protein CN308_02445 [Bacillus cereus]
MNEKEYMNKLNLFKANPELLNDKQLCKEMYEYCMNSVEILEHAKAILLFPKDETATIQRVAWFYKVDKKVITKLVFSHLDELTSDGYSNGAFTKRAILRVGMLLDDNEIANKVMTQILNYA